MAALSATNGPIQNSSGPTSSMAPSTQPPTSTDDASQHGSPQSDQEAAGALSAYILMQRILPPPQRGPVLPMIRPIRNHFYLPC
eukprot:1157916-Pelagomonas_calceolata.AAC.4